MADFEEIYERQTQKINKKKLKKLFIKMDNLSKEIGINKITPAEIRKMKEKGRK